MTLTLVFEKPKVVLLPAVREWVDAKLIEWESHSYVEMDRSDLFDRVAYMIEYGLDPISENNDEQSLSSFVELSSYKWDGETDDADQLFDADDHDNLPEGLVSVPLGIKLADPQAFADWLAAKLVERRLVASVNEA